MGKRQKLLQKAKDSPQNLSFDELCLLCEHYGMVLRKKSGSHRVYKRARKPMFSLSIQSDGGAAKPYQVRQLIDLLTLNGLIEVEEK